MKPGLRTHKQASLRIATPEGLPQDMWPHTRELLEVQSTDTGKGHATALLWQVCAEADLHCAMLMLQVKPFRDGLTAEQLERFYGKFGFVRVQDEPLLMARQVQPRSVLH